jgi:hypothetical protein
MNETELDCYSPLLRPQISSNETDDKFLDNPWASSDDAPVVSALAAHRGQPVELFMHSARLANIVSFCDGIVTIDFEGNSDGPRSALSTVRLRNLVDKVLVVFLPNGEPLIVGQVYPFVPIVDGENENSDVLIRGRRVRIEAENELVLIAGRTKIHLDARGKVVTSADQVVSRARSTNRLQGGNVQIN